MYIQGFRTTRGNQEYIEQLRPMSPSGLRRGRQGSGPSQGKQAIHREMRNSKHLENKFLSGHPETMERSGESVKQTDFAWLLPVCHP